MVFNNFQRSNLYSTAASSGDGYSLVSGSTDLNGIATPVLLGFVAENTNTSTIYVQVFDGYSSSALTVGQVPIAELQIAASSQGSLDFSQMGGISVKHGILLACSSSQWSFAYAGTKMLVSAFWLRL